MKNRRIKARIFWLGPDYRKSDTFLLSGHTDHLFPVVSSHWRLECDFRLDFLQTPPYQIIEECGQGKEMINLIVLQALVEEQHSKLHFIV